MVDTIFSDDEKAIEKLKSKLSNLQKERESMREFNINARKNKTPPIPTIEFNRMKYNVDAIKRRIKYLESIKNLPNNEFNLNGVKVVENYKLKRFQLFFNDQPNYNIFVKLQNKDFVYNKTLNCWEKEIKVNNSEYLEILKTEDLGLN